MLQRIADAATPSSHTYQQLRKDFRRHYSVTTTECERGQFIVKEQDSKDAEIV
jgi:endonuclease I